MRQRLHSPKTERRPDFTDLHNPKRYSIEALVALAHDKFSCHRLKTDARLKPPRLSRSFSNSELERLRKMILDSYKSVSVNKRNVYKSIKELLRVETIYDRELELKTWMILSGARESLLSNPGYYDALTRSFPDFPDVFVNQIDLDVVRTFPDMAYFTTEKTRESLRRVLLAYAKRNGYVGYCQGFNVIVGKMIPFMTEEEAFWLFTTLVECVLPLEYYTNMAGAIADLRVLNLLIGSMFPEIGRKLREIGLDLSLFTLRWFVCVYASVFNEEVLFNHLLLTLQMLFPIWDFLFTHGDVALFKVALWLIKRFSAEILVARDFTDVLHVFNDKCLAELNDVDGLRKFFSSCYINKRVLNVLRVRVLRSVQREEEEANKKRKRQTPRRHKTVELPQWTICSVEWPVCLRRLDTFRKAKRTNPFLVFREAHPPRMIVDYFSEKQTPATAENREEDETTLSNQSAKTQRREDLCESNLVIFRESHVCTGAPPMTPPPPHLIAQDSDQALRQYMTSSYFDLSTAKPPTRSSFHSTHSDFTRNVAKPSHDLSPLSTKESKPTFLSSVFRLNFNGDRQAKQEERKEGERVLTEENTVKFSNSDSEEEEEAASLLDLEARAPYKSSFVYYTLGQGRGVDELFETPTLQFAQNYARRFNLLP